MAFYGHLPFKVPTVFSSVLVSFDFCLEALLVVALNCNLEPPHSESTGPGIAPDLDHFYEDVTVPHRVPRYKNKEMIRNAFNLYQFSI